MARIAITGGMAEGKTSVLEHLRSLGFATSSADEIAREVFADPEIQARLAAATGLSAPIDRGELRRRLFEEPSLRREINRITHPEIVGRLRRGGAEVIEVPLLIETCLQGEFDQVWVVTCGAEEQRVRLLRRLGESHLVESALASQLPTEAKIPFADLVVRTNREPKDVQRFVASAAARIKR